MIGVLARWAIITVAILIAANIVPGIHIKDFQTALIAAAILGILNALVRPILVVLTLPVTVLTLGLFLFVINALMFQFAGHLVTGFHVQSFWSALLGSLVVSIVSYVSHSVGRA